MAIQFDSSIDVDGALDVDGTFTSTGNTLLAQDGPTSLVSIGSANSTVTQLNISSSATGNSYIAATNSLGINVNNTTGIKILSNGNVGIGSTNPGVKLEAAGNTKIDGYLKWGQSSGGQVQYMYRGDGGIFAKQTATSNSIYSGSSYFSVRNSSDTSNLLFVNNTGNVGIGTTSPNTALEVDGAISTTTSDYVQGTTGSRLLLETSGSGNTHSYIQAQNSGGTSSAEDLALQLYGGNVGIGTDSPNQKLTIKGTDQYVAAEQTNYAWGSANTLGVRMGTDATAGLLDFRRWTGTSTTHGTALITQVNSDGGYGLDFRVDTKSSNTVATTSRMFLSQSGEVGIGTTSPNQELHVAGSGYFEDGLFVGSTSNVMFNYISTFAITAGSGQTIALGGGPGNINNNVLIGNGNLSVSGNVGIGITYPSEKLEVVGNANITNNLYVGQSNTLNSCTYPAQYSLVVGTSNALGGISNGIIGVGNTIACTAEPWMNFGGNFIAGRNNEINNLYSHANAVFGQDNAVGAFDVPSNSVAGTLVCGNVNTVNGNNALAFGYTCFVDQYADNSLTGGYDSNNFGFYGSVAIGAGATASAGNNQYAFGTGITTPTFAGYAYGADQFVVGKYNEYTNSSSVPHRFAVGNGSWDGSRDTPFCVIGGGAYTNGQVSINDSDGYAYTSTPYSVFHVNGRATSSFSSSFTFVSDERVKKNIVSYDKGLSEILQVQPKSYVFNGKANTIEGLESIGVLAQEIKEVFPETVGTANKRLNPEDEHETELYAVDISPVTYALINAVKELNAKIETLESRIQTLEGN